VLKVAFLLDGAEGEIELGQDCDFGLVLETILPDCLAADV
jgi:hypothetical protein